MSFFLYGHKPFSHPLMHQTPRLLLSGLALAAGLGACGRKDQVAGQAGQPTTATAATPGAAATAPSETPPAAGAAPAAFDVSTVPVSTAKLGRFPYIAGLKGTSLNTNNSKEFDFERAYVYDGKTLLAIEGKVSRRLFDADRSGENPKKLSELAIDRNYENLLKELGAVKVWTGIIPKEAVDKIGNDEFYKHEGFGTDMNNASDTYLIRQKDKEIWVQLNSQSEGDYGIDVVEKAVMPTLTTVMPAADLKKTLEADGHVALYLNFDTDKATLRPDAQPTLAEVQKLLADSPNLRLAVQGHTDNTSTPAHNQQLSEARAQAVVASLAQAGIAASRLQAAGFGQTKPLAENTTETGKAKNRRVELVKM